jgi:methylglutaconyl-CoA hydratase
MDTPTLLLEIDERGVATVTLNRPNKHNAFDDHMVAQLTTRFRQLAKNDKVKVVVLTANGSSFSAGADLAWMQRITNYSFDENIRDADNLVMMLSAINNMPKPVIARVQGLAIGGGVGLVSCCDIAVATEDVEFCLSEVKIGLIPSTIGPYIMAAIGTRAARRYFITAERFSAQQAHLLGLVSEVVPPEELDAKIEAFVEQLLANGPKAMNAAKKMIFDLGHQTIDKAVMSDTSQRIARMRISTEGQEGLQAFLEKRKPEWDS